MKKRSKLSLHRETITMLEKSRLNGAGPGPTNSCESVCWCGFTHTCPDYSCGCGTDQASVCICI